MELRTPFRGRGHRANAGDHGRRNRRTLACSAVLFDLNGTLVDSTEAVLRGWSAWARAVGVPAEGLADFVHGRTVAETIIALMPGIAGNELRRQVRYVLHLQERDPVPAHPAPGAAALIESLTGHPWAVVTDSSAEMATKRLTAGGLPRPGVLVTEEDAWTGKPHPEGYLLALRRLGVVAGKAVAIEDTPAGVDAAKAAGIRILAVTTTHPTAMLRRADLVVAGLEHLTITATGGHLTLIAHVADAE